MNLTIYNNAKSAIAEYKTVDEVKSFRDKALAVEAYAKQAQDFELEYDAAIARVRAERKCGSLLSDLDKPQGKRSDLNLVERNDQVKTLSEMGINKDQSSKWQQLAKMPEHEFETAINVGGAKPSTNSMLKKKDDIREKINSLDKRAMACWGVLIGMEREDVFSRSIEENYNDMTDAMKLDTDRIIKLLKQWVNEYE